MKTTKNKPTKREKNKLSCPHCGLIGHSPEGYKKCLALREKPVKEHNCKNPKRPCFDPSHMPKKPRMCGCGYRYDGSMDCQPPEKKQEQGCECRIPCCRDCTACSKSPPQERFKITGWGYIDNKGAHPSYEKENPPAWEEAMLSSLCEFGNDCITDTEMIDRIAQLLEGERKVYSESVKLAGRLIERWDVAEKERIDQATRAARREMFETIENDLFGKRELKPNSLVRLSYAAWESIKKKLK